MEKPLLVPSIGWKHLLVFKFESACTHFQQGEGHNRDLLLDCENIAEGSLRALLFTVHDTRVFRRARTAMWMTARARCPRPSSSPWRGSSTRASSSGESRPDLDMTALVVTSTLYWQVEPARLPARHHRDVPRLCGRIPQDHGQGLGQDPGPGRGGRQHQGSMLDDL